jgi:hypothetical protein
LGTASTQRERCCASGAEAIAWAFDIDETIQDRDLLRHRRVARFDRRDRFWPEDWLGSPLL